MARQVRARQQNHTYSLGDTIVSGGYTQVATVAGRSGLSTPAFNTMPNDLWHEAVPGGVTWTNGGNRTYWNACSQRVGMQYLNWAYSIARWNGTREWNIFPWGMYMDYFATASRWGRCARREM